MALSGIKTWIEGEVLSASDLNAEFSNIIDNQQSLGTPRTAAWDMNGKELILDADGDTSITSDTDDQIDIKISGADDFKFTANTLSILSGSTLVVDSGATLSIDDTTDSTSGTTGSQHTDGGIGAVKDIVTDATLKPLGDTAAGDKAAIGYTTSEGLILTGQGSVSDLTAKNDADATIFDVATGTVNVDFKGAITQVGAGWTAPSFSAGDFTGSGSMTWTVDSGDVDEYAYIINGKTMTVIFGIVTSTVGGTGSTALQIAIPASKVATREVYNTVVIKDSGSDKVSKCRVLASGTVIQFFPTVVGSSNWSLNANNSSVIGQITFEIN